MKKTVLSTGKFNIFLLTVGCWLAFISWAWAWPNGKLDTASEKNYCYSCHDTRGGGTVTLLDVSVNGTSKGAVSEVSLTAGQALEITYRVTGLGYGLNGTVAGAVQVPATYQWQVANPDTPWSDNGQSDLTPWAVAKQDTAKNAPLYSPFMFVTDFPANSTPVNQQGVTLDDGSNGTPGDRNRKLHDEVFKVKLIPPATQGVYTIYVQGIGRDSTGNLAYAQQAVTVKVVASPALQPHGKFTDPGRQDLCKLCHSTHSAHGYQLVLKDTVADTCYVCHDGTASVYNVKSQFDVQANPSHHKVPEGKTFCQDCHNPHFSNTDSTSAVTGKKNGSIRLLAAQRNVNGTLKGPNYSGNDVCWTCHGAPSDLPRPFGIDHQTFFANSVHNIGNDPNSLMQYASVDANLNPVAPTSSPQTDGIAMVEREPITGESATGTMIACLNCHKPHGSSNYPLLRWENKANLCINCHVSKGFNYYQYSSQNKINNSSNTFIGSIHDQKFAAWNGCMMCHEPHGSKYQFMITAPFVNKPYPTAVTHNRNELCFKCHDYRYYWNNDSNPIVGSRFGNGNGRNYHWHVTKYDLSCRTCHDPHGGNNQYFDKSNTNAYKDGVKVTNSNWDLNNPVMVSFDWSYLLNAVGPTNGRLAFYATGTDSQGNATGYACYLNCKASHRPKGYLRNPYAGPALNCAACHDQNEFDKNSAHPIIYAGTSSGKKVSCDTCHEPDHTKHTGSNPYGLKNPVAWTDPVSGTAVTPDPVSVPNFATTEYRDWCFTCHGTTRHITEDYQANFTGKPHASLSRSNSKYGTTADGVSKDQPCLVCHEHHASTNVRLLRRDIDTTDTHAIDADTDVGKVNACLDCHDGYPAKQDIRKLYYAETSAGHFIKSVDSTKKLLCTECHSPHGTTNAKYLWDRDKYGTLQFAGTAWPTNKTGSSFNVREFCLVCHPTSDQPSRVYYTGNTIKVTSSDQPANSYKITIKPLPASIASHSSTSTDKCDICHDPHKPWPATGSNADCYLCHGKRGEAYNIEALMGQEGTLSAGKISRHKIYDPNTADTNDCMTKCHLAHPHNPRSNNIKAVDEKTLCFNCHDTNGSPGPQPRIDMLKYAGKPHDYVKQEHAYSDGSGFGNNCTKCHNPHGSDYKPLLKWANGDTLCYQCHDGLHTDGNGATISNIKTLYQAYGHYLKSDPTKKLKCADCHFPHGTSNTKYLRDADVSEAIYTNGDTNQLRTFPSNIGSNDSRRPFCTVCHLPNNQDASADFVRWVDPDLPGGQIDLAELPLVGPKSGITLSEHTAVSTANCMACHNPHDPRPVGSNKDCYKCHGGSSALAPNIDQLAGLWDGTQNTWPDGLGGRTTTSSIVSYHKITDALSPDTNTCMTNCHKPHSHNPKADLIKDRTGASGDVTPPNAPSGLSAQALAKSLVKVSWTPSDSSDIFGYYIYRNDFTDANAIGVINNTSTTGTVSFYDGAVRGTPPFTYKIKAFDRAGNSTWLNTTVNVSPAYTSDTTAPSAPADLKAVALNSARISLTWSRSTDASGVKGYYIYRSTDGTNFTRIGFSGTTSFVDAPGLNNGILPSTTYWYKVTAIDKTLDLGGTGNESGYSNVASVTTPTATIPVTNGLYKSGSDVVEFFDYQNGRTNIFPAGTNIRVKVTTSTINNATTRRVIVYSKTGGQLATYTMSQTSTSAPYTYEVTFTRSTPGLYYFLVEVSSGAGTIRAYEAVEIAATTEHYRTYADSGYTTEKLEFQAGQVVYGEVSANVNGTIGTTTATLYRMDGTTAATLTASNVAYNGNYIRFQVTWPSGLNAGDWYSLYIRVRNTGGTTLVNEYKMLKNYAVDTTPPSAPTISSLQPGSNSVVVNWSASTPADDVAGYSIYRSSDGTNYIKVGSVDAANLSFTDSGLKGNTQYWYRVSAFDLSGNAATGAAVTTTTAAEPVDNVAPPPPAGVNATPIKDIVTGSMAVELTWAPASAADGVVGYNIYRIVPGFSQPLKVGSTTGTTWTDLYLKGTTSYSYYVTAFDLEGNESSFSTKVTALTLVDPMASLERALCMTCHDGTGSPPGAPVIGTSYNSSKHNVDVPVDTFSDGSIYYGNCTKCHVPHGSQYPSLLKKAKDNELCFDCHTNASSNYKYSGRRTFEMSAHSRTTDSPSGTPIVFPNSYGTGGTRDPYSAADKATYAGKCFNCHTPHGKFVPTEHGGDGVSVTRASTLDSYRFTVGADTFISVNALCEGCHAAVSFGAWNGFTIYNKTAHGNKNNLLVRWDNESAPSECTNCHDPHGTDYGSMLKLPMNTDAVDSNGNSLKNSVCFWCHDKPEVIAQTYWFRGKAAYNASEHASKAKWYDSATGQSAMFVPGNCMNCHSPHGKEDPNNPGNPYPKQLLKNPDNNELCYNCHDSVALVKKVYGTGVYWYEAAAPGYPTVYWKGGTNNNDNTIPDTELVDPAVKIAGQSLFSVSSHGSNANAKWPGGTEGGNYTQASNAAGACYNCHDPHGSGYQSSTLKPASDLCFTCHDGTGPSSKNVAGQFDGTVGHTVKDPNYIARHVPGQDPAQMNYDDNSKTVQCVDCHNTHILKTKDTFVQDNLKASGIDVNGNFKQVADYQYEVCIKCHSTFGSKTTLPTGWSDVRSRFQTTHDSHHGVFGVKGTNTYVNSTTLTAYGLNILNRTPPAGQGKVLCSDCHYTHTGTDVSNPYNLKLSTDSAVSTAPLIVKHCTLCHKPTSYGYTTSTDSRFSDHSKGDHKTSNGCYECHGDPSVKGYMHGFTWNRYGKFIRGRAIAEYYPSNIGSKNGCYLLQGTCGSHTTRTSRTSGS